jgi:hypothetical protein
MYSSWNENWWGTGKQYLEKPWLCATLSTTNSIPSDGGSNMGSRNGKSDTNDLSYGMAYVVITTLFRVLRLRKF